MPPIERSFPAETLKAFRAWLGLSQDDVASILGIGTRSVQAYEGQGGPEWMRFALLGWAVLVHGATPRAAARYLGFPWEHHPLPGSPESGDSADQDTAQLAALLARSAGPSDADDDLVGDDETTAGSPPAEVAASNRLVDSVPGPVSRPGREP